MNQKQATVAAIMSTLEANGVSYELNGETPVSEVLTSDFKETIRETLFAQFRDGSIEYKDTFQSKVDDDSELKKYISGLLNNWIRKHKEFNGGQVYKTKNPGSRAHSSDDQMKALKALLVQSNAAGADESVIAQIEAAIVTRKAEIKPKSVAKPINVDALPEHLRGLVTSN